jgi:hypothetical protein
MKNLLALISAIFFFANASYATIDGFITKVGSGLGGYTVPTGKILVLQQLSYSPSESAANHYLSVNNVSVYFPAATNGLYTLPKALSLPGGTTITSPNTLPILVFGVIIDTSDAPLFVGGGSSWSNVSFANNTITGELQLSSTAASKVLIQSSTNLVDWRYDSSVVVLHGPDKTKVSFAAPTSGPSHFYRAFVRRINAG